MTSPAYCTFDGDGSTVAPYRPGIADVGGAEWIDDQQYPPIPPEMIMAGDVISIARLAVRACRMVPALRVTVSVGTGSDAAVEGFVCSKEAIVLSSFTLNNPATGVITLTWPAGSLPPKRCRPTVTFHGNVDMRGVVSQAANAITVTTFDDNGAAAYVDFTVEIDGE